MNAKRLILEADPDPKSFAQTKVPGIYQQAIDWAMDKFTTLCDAGDVVYGARTADDKAAELATAACVLFHLNDNEDWEKIVTPLFKKSAEIFPERDEKAEGNKRVISTISKSRLKHYRRGR
jgi:hypothetical protein